MRPTLPSRLLRALSAGALLLLASCAAPTRTALAAPPPATDARHGALRSALQAKLDAWHAAGRFPGATLGVSLPDGSTLALATGVSDRERRTPMHPTDRMLAGSVGKTFVAAAALQLVREGRLSLDTPLSRHLGEAPWFPRLPNAEDLTVRMLLNHTSGIQRYEFKPAVTELLTREPDKVWTPEERVGFVLGDVPPFRAGEGWDYSDTNYILLGMVVERVTGAELYAELQRRFLAPHALSDTLPSDRRVLPGLVQGYAGEGNPFGGTDAMLTDGRMAVNPQMEWAGGGFASTAADLARWVRLLYGGHVLGAETTAEMLQGVPAPMLGPDVRYGLGVILRPSPHGVTSGHSGFFPGWLTDTVYVPALDTGLAVQVNTSVRGATGRPTSALLQELAAVVAAHGAGGTPAR
jgi:D-alanyl-D-alanine carboxypeptidase